MYELMIENLSAYAFATVFTGLFVSLIICGTFKKTKNTQNKIAKTFLRFGISIILVSLWMYYFVYMNLYPVSLACYEYKYGFVEEKIGIIDSIEQNTKDRICLIIDNTTYTMVHSSVRPFTIVGKDINEGDAVKIIIGERSKYVFEIHSTAQ